jgi:hypothetical protein
MRQRCDATWAYVNERSPACGHSNQPATTSNKRGIGTPRRSILKIMIITDRGPKRRALRSRASLMLALANGLAAVMATSANRARCTVHRRLSH